MCLDKVTATASGSASLWNCFISFALFTSIRELAFCSNLVELQYTYMYMYIYEYIKLTCMYVYGFFLLGSCKFSLPVAFDDIVALSQTIVVVLTDGISGA